MEIFLAVVVILTLVVWFVPTTVQYVEQINVDASRERVYDAIRQQAQLMQWSAWPEATGSTCSVEGDDGEVGAKTVFFNKGKRFGHQEIIALEVNQRVSMTLVDSGPLKHIPYLDFELESITKNKTRVVLKFKNTYRRPFQVPARLFGIVRWVRKLHLKDLDGLKIYVEKNSK